MRYGATRPLRPDPEHSAVEGSTPPPGRDGYGWRERLSAFRRRAAVLMPISLGLVVLLVALALWRSFQPGPEQLTTGEVAETVSAIMAEATPAPAISTLVYQAILPSLVVVQTTGAQESEDGWVGVGSGVVVSADAAVLTALHVVEGASEIQITFADGVQAPATIASADPENDIAVLTPAILPGLIVPATLGNPRSVRVGHEIFAVGHPLALAGSLSAGVVSGLDRDFHPSNNDRAFQGLIQFDAAVNRGNSGGPLVDRRGQVVGIVTGLLNPTEHDVFIGIGFAVPIDIAAQAAGGPGL